MEVKKQLTEEGAQRVELHVRHGGRADPGEQDDQRQAHLRAGTHPKRATRQVTRREALNGGDQQGGGGGSGAVVHYEQTARDAASGPRQWCTGIL